MWQKISQDLMSILAVKRTPLQCENRFKTALKRKKNAVNKNRRTGESPTRVPFEDELSSISSKDDSIEPEVCLDARQCVVQNKENKGDIDKNNGRNIKKDQSLQEVLIELNRNKEEARERKHREKMDLMKKLCESLFANKNE